MASNSSPAVRKTGAPEKKYKCQFCKSPLRTASEMNTDLVIKKATEPSQEVNIAAVMSAPIRKKDPSSV
jgi:hypothetical protein